MLQFFLGDIEVELNADTSFEFKRENPFFTKEGDYTYDIDISLRSKVNASLFNGIRKFSNKNLEYDKTGTLKENDIVICKGKVIVLEKDDDTLKLQLLSDNSELNYIVNDVNVRDLDLGRATINMTDILENADKIYPDINYAFPMIEGYYDDYKKYDVLNNYGSIVSGNFKYDSVRPNLYAQPFLIFIIRLVFDALGYVLGNTFIEEYTKWKRLIMINPYTTNEYAKMLPNWTATDFLDEIEKFFNGTFVVSGMDVRFERVGDWYESVGEEVISDGVIDKFDIEFLDDDSKEVLGNSNNNVNYKGTDNQFWKAAKLEDEFINNCTVVETEPIDDEDYESYNIYSDARTGLYVKPYAEKERKEDDDGNKKYVIVEGSNHLVQIHQYKPYVTDDSKEAEELKIFPAEIANVLNGIFVPAVTIKNAAASNQVFWDAVDGEESEDTIDYMNVAFYIGMQQARIGYTNVDSSKVAPQCSTMYHQFRATKTEPFAKYTNGNILDYDEYMTLELAGTKGRGINELENNIIWDDAHKYTIRFLTKDILDPKKIFMIKGRKFICKELKYTFENCRMKPYCEGVFYPME